MDSNKKNVFFWAEKITEKVEKVTRKEQKKEVGIYIE